MEDGTVIVIGGGNCTSIVVLLDEFALSLDMTVTVCVPSGMEDGTVIAKERVPTEVTVTFDGNVAALPPNNKSSTIEKAEYCARLTVIDSPRITGLLLTLTLPLPAVLE